MKISKMGMVRPRKNVREHDITHDDDACLSQNESRP